MSAREDAVWFYQSGLSCKDVAPLFGVSESTIKRWMREAGVIRSEASKQGRPPEDECHQGHDMSKWRRRDKSGNPYCLLCKRERDHKNWKKRMAKKTKQTPEPKPPKEYGKESGTFSKPHPVKPGACKTCGATPPCH